MNLVYQAICWGAGQLHFPTDIEHQINQLKTDILIENLLDLYGYEVLTKIQDQIKLYNFCDHVCYI